MATTPETLDLSTKHWYARLADDRFTAALIETRPLARYVRWTQLDAVQLRDLIGTARAS